MHDSVIGQEAILKPTLFVALRFRLLIQTPLGQVEFGKEDISFDPEDLYRLLAVKYKTFAIPGRCFEFDNRYFRLGYGATLDEIEKGLQNIENALGDVS